MIALHFRLAWRSLRRAPWFSAVMVFTLAVAVSNWYVMAQVFGMLYRLPPASDGLYALELTRPSEHPDMHQLDYNYAGKLSSVLLGTRDAEAMIAAGHDPALGDTVMTATYDTRATVSATEGGERLEVRARVASHELFGLFSVPFAAGGPWTYDGPPACKGACDEPDEAVVSHALAERLFGAADETALGKKLYVRGVPLRVVGVQARSYERSPRLYDFFSYMSDEDLILPRRVAERLELAPTLVYRAGPHAPGFAALRDSHDGWLVVWIRLASADDAPGFLAAAQRYVELARRVDGPYAPTGVRLRPATRWRSDVMRPEGPMEAWPIVTGLVLLACGCNLVRLLMAKFSRRGLDFGLLRSFGARRRTLLVQLLLEAALIGLGAGVVGALLGVVGVGPSRTAYWLPLPRFDVATFAEAVGLALGITLLAALYPAWRLARATPAAHLRRA